jgi:two-component system chemotaxis response regulator CheB
MRRIIRGALLAHPDINVIGTANDGAAAVAFVQHTRPDVVIMDIEMPVMDGLEALREIRKFDWTLPIIMFSSLTHAGAQSSLAALTSGASDYAAKPSNLSDQKECNKLFNETLIPKIRALCQKKTASFTSTQPQTMRLPQLSPVTAKPATPSIASVSTSTATATSPRFALKSVEAVCIGVSTGGPAALAKVFAAWPEPLSVPVFIVQHMPPQFTELLAKKLTSISGMPVKEPVDGEVALAGQAYIAPGGYHMIVKDLGGRVTMHLNQDPPENFCRPAVDVLFRSASKVYASRLLGVVLTGMGSDGMLGAQQISASGGQVIVQDEATSLIWGMPGAVVQAGLADKILPLEEVHNEISIRIARKKSLTS